MLTLDTLVAALDAEAREVATLPAVVEEFSRLAAAHSLPDTPEGRLAYARVKLAFEATRDGGWWGLRWAITNEEPRSDRIWAQWAARPDPDGVTAVAECDELSALFAFLARRMGVSGIGLFWPTQDHTVAVWKARSIDGHERRIVAPTSMIYLGPDERLDTRGFDPWRQTRIYDYARADAPGSFVLPEDLGSFFLAQVDRWSGIPEAALHEARNVRAAVLSGAMSPEEAGGAPLGHAAAERALGDEMRGR